MLSIVRVVGALAIALLLASQPAGMAWAVAGGDTPVGGIRAAGTSAVGQKVDFGLLPLTFIENQGQLDERVAYYVQGKDKVLYFTSAGMSLALSASSAPGLSLERGWELNATPTTQRWVVKLDFLGARPGVRPEGLDRTEAVISYFHGSPDQWRAGLPTYARIVYRDLWPGIDLVYYGTVNRLKYEFRVRPGADPGQIRLAYRGASAVRVDEAGRLQVSTPLGSFSDEAPLAYQEGEDGQQLALDVAYAAPEATSGAYGFRVGAYDPSKLLVLDPAVLLYCGYLGGSGSDTGYSIAVDKMGNAYITGETWGGGTPFPVLVGPDLTYNGDKDVFVVKVNAAGTALLYAGYIGGQAHDAGYGIAVDDTGNAYVTGYTVSSEATFPVLVGPDLTFGGDQDAFVAKVNAAGTALVYCGYIGGTGGTSGQEIAVDGAGNAYVVGSTAASEATFPVTVGPDLSHNGGTDAFVAKVNAAGTALAYGGYIGGAGGEEGLGIAVDDAGNAYVTGSTASSEETFPVVVGPDLTYNGGRNDAFVAKVDAAGTALAYCGYIGGTADSGWEGGHGIAIDEAGDAMIAGMTYSSEDTFPVTVGPDLTYNGDGDAFVAKVGAMGAALAYCGYIGGTGWDSAFGVAVDAAGRAYVTGRAESSEETFPVIIGPDLTYNGGRSDAYMAVVDTMGAALLSNGYIGGAGSDEGLGIALDEGGNAYVTGWTESGEGSFPATVGPDLTYNGDLDAFVAKVGPACVAAADLACGGSDARRNEGEGSTNTVSLYACTDRAETGPEVAYRFSPRTSATVTVALSGLSADLDILVLGGLPACNPGGCIAYGDDSATFEARAGGSYTLVVEGRDGAVSPYTISVSCVEHGQVFLPLILRMGAR